MNRPANLWLFGISLILLGTSIFLNISQTVITNESVVLTFVGILATFIVVGNYAQVTEIRNDTNKQIKALEAETKKKIAELDILFDKFTKASKKIEEIEKETIFNSAEAYRLFGYYTGDKKLHQVSIAHCINSISCYCRADHGFDPKVMNGLLDTILGNLKPEYWNQSKNDFEFDNLIIKVKTFPDSWEKKQKIIDLLEKYKEENKK